LQQNPFPNASISLGYTEGEASSIINVLHPTTLRDVGEHDRSAARKKETP